MHNFHSNTNPRKEPPNVKLEGLYQQTFTAHGYTFTLSGGTVFGPTGEILGRDTDDLDHIARTFALEISDAC